MIDKLQLLTSITVALALGLASGCKNGGEDDGTGDGTTNAESESTGPGMTSMVTESAEGDSSSGTTTASTIGTTTGPVCENADPNGTNCSDGCDCMSNECFVVGALGGVCSDCDADGDCADTTGFGCNFGNPLTMVPAVCSETGALGEGCETSDACAADLQCTTLIDVTGVISAATCSECETDADCSGGQLCAPTYDIENIAGHYRCVDPGSVPDDEGCDLSGGGSGNEQCDSGNCAPAAIEGVVVLGVCSPCNTNDDCPGMGTCELPALMLDGTMLVLQPGQCV
ncbi:MAG: hypothetical protein KDK70_07065 [Myxococcales bacterium]|nr:hypothetical protein [Myxococcales bacterium]